MSRSVRQFKETIEMRSLSPLRFRSNKYFPAATLLSALLLVACLHIWQRVHVIHLVREVGELTITNQHLVDETKKTQTEVAALTMASRVQEYAADSLGMKPMSTDRLVTIVKGHETAPPPTDELANVVNSFKRVVDYLPVMEETKAAANELKPIRFDSLRVKESKP